MTAGILQTQIQRLDKNGEMQHESIIATASNENTHRRLASFSGRGRSEEFGTASMTEGDFIDSRAAAIRHDVPSCGADVPHDETQLAALSNKLAGFTGDGSDRGASPSSLSLPCYSHTACVCVSVCRGRGAAATGAPLRLRPAVRRRG